MFPRKASTGNIVTKVLDYRRIHAEIDEIRELAAQYAVAFLLYSQNDQVSKRISIGPIHKQLSLGYSSFSAIDGADPAERITQMRTCLADFLRCGRPLPFFEACTTKDHQATSLGSELTGKRQRAVTIGPAAGESTGSFSLIFDTEQLGGVRYGLPRFLDVLDR